ncbi:MAG: SoxR reducing system RseC family protein [Rikenellaceae bacterium]
MKANSCIDKPAIITGLKKSSVIVEIQVNEACGSCAAKTVCGNGSTEKRQVTIKNIDPSEFTLGQRVTISIKRQTGYKAVFLCYVMPFLVFMCSLILTLALGLNELSSGVISLSSIFFYYGILMLFKNKIENKIDFTLTKLH